jgi:hypothetical protein
MTTRFAKRVVPAGYELMVSAWPEPPSAMCAEKSAGARDGMEALCSVLLNPTSRRPFLNFVLIDHPEEKPRRAVRDFSGSTGEPSDGGGPPSPLSVTNRGLVRSLARRPYITRVKGFRSPVPFYTDSEVAVDYSTIGGPSEAREALARAVPGFPVLGKHGPRPLFCDRFA